MNIHLSLLPSVYCVAKFDTNDEVPANILTSGEFFSLTKSPEEISLLCAQALLPTNIVSDSDWRIFRYEGSLDDRATGIVASITQPLSENSISVIVTTTYGAGYFGVKNADLTGALMALNTASIIVD